MKLSDSETKTRKTPLNVWGSTESVELRVESVEQFWSGELRGWMIALTYHSISHIECLYLSFLLWMFDFLFNICYAETKGIALSINFEICQKLMEIVFCVIKKSFKIAKVV